MPVSLQCTKGRPEVATNLQKFRDLLHELFQLDQADLDFGIYRIMNAKRDEIVRFLDKDLLPQVKEAFKQYKSADKSDLETELHKLVTTIESAGMNPNESPKAMALKDRLSESAVDVTALENEVFSHLFNFFRRYYAEGDFISQRRYKEGVYAIPYEGEEVKLHWANADQYYVKSSETFRDYMFKVAEDKRVTFQLVAASTEQDNNKASQGKERRFVLRDDPLAEQNGELVIQFEYRALEEKVKQDELNSKAAKAILSAPGFEPWTTELGRLAPTEKNPDRTLLQKHLTKYTARNTFDYFIHKDLGGFLRRELDFYIKNEVMHLDDIEHESAPKVEQYLSQIKVIRIIAHKIIQFLEQLENFQKKLWLKKKFVVETNYCITLDRVPVGLLWEVAANEAQREEWVRLFSIDEIEKDLHQPGYSEPLTIEFLKANPFLVLDTGLFEPSFTARLVAGLDDIDSLLDGIAIHSENFQALNLTVARFRSSVRATYIDPPYNTGDDGFPYKDSYQHSSWLSMLADRLALGRVFDTPESTLVISIDDEELDRLCQLLRVVYGENELAKLVWDRNRKNDAKHFSVGHEYMVVVARNAQHLKDTGAVFREPKDGIGDVKEYFEKLVSQHGDDWNAVREGWLDWFREIPVSDPRRRLIRFNKVGKRGPYRDDGNINWPGGGGPKYEVLHPVTQKPCRKPVSGWRYPTPERFWEEYEAGTIAFGDDENRVPSTISYLFEGDGQVMPSVFYSYAQTASQEFDALFGDRVFDNPKSWRDLYRVIRYLTPADSRVVDYFAGSGTTAHAIINLNRDDESNRKYMLVEMGDYFNTVLRPRVAKIIYSGDWKDGKPIGRIGSGHAYKYIRLESYEDTINNLELSRADQQSIFLNADADLREQYVLKYMLDVESRGSQSLLNVDAFRNPDEYKLKVERNGETRLVNVDLVETFSWLLGLTVKHVDVIRGVRVVEGTAPVGDRVLVLWRNIDQTNNDALDAWFEKQGYNTREMLYDVFYVNGDNNLENLRRPDQTWKVRLIEEEFHRLMFEVQDV
jgi:adenine-specific DNA-methyltransferase